MPSAARAAEHGPRYTLEVVEGETTFPEHDPIASTSAEVEPSAQVAVSISRNGTTVYKDVQEEGSAWLSQVPQVGETVTLESPVGTVIGAFVYDGLPSIDPTVCAGSTNFSGANSPGFTVEGFYTTYSLVTDPYTGKVTGTRRHSSGEAQVKSLTGTTFGGSFLTPLAIGQTVGAVESLKTPLPGEATYTYISEFQRPVGACPPPPPAPSPPPPPPALSGSVLRLPHATLRSLLRLGHLSDQVTINQPGTVVQDLYLENGTVPAGASVASVKHRHRGRHRRHRPAATLVAAGSTPAKAAGTVAVTLKLTSRGRRRLAHAHSARLVLVTTLHASSGAKLNLGRRSITLHR